MASYATGKDLIARYDVDVVGDLCWDERETQDRDDVPNHPNVLTALADASGEIDVALVVGERYRASDLESLAGNSKNKLARITCDIAMSLLLARRVDDMFADLAEKIAKISRGHLIALQRGENLFGIASVQGAGTIDIETVSTMTIDQRNLLPTRMGNYFPGTAQRSPGY